MHLSIQGVSRNVSSNRMYQEMHSSIQGVQRNASSYRMYQEMSLPIQGVTRNESSYKVYKNVHKPTHDNVSALHSMSACVSLLNLYASKSYTLYLIHHSITLHIKPLSNNSIQASFIQSYPTFIHLSIYLLVHKYICM